MINWLHNNYGGYKAESILINCHYPVTQDSFVLQWGVIVEKPKGVDEAMSEKLSEAMTVGVSKGFVQDVEIWKHKTRIDNPLLVEEDGAVYQMRRWYQQFYVDVADVTPDMTDRFELEVDTTAANEKWNVEVEENLKKQAESDRNSRPSERRREPPDVDDLARSMLVLHGVHGTTIPTGHDDGASGSWSKAPDFADDPERAAAIREATRQDRERYLSAGLATVDCRFCHVCGEGQEARRRAHRGAVEHRRPAAVRLLRRDSRGRRAAVPAPGPARSCRTASSTPWPRVAWRSTPAPPPPATASFLARELPARD